jgi:hypothetical protein
MCGDVGDDGGLTCGIGGMARGPGEISGCCHRMAARSARLRHCDLAAYPRPGLVNGLPRPRVGRLL